MEKGKSICIFSIEQLKFSFYCGDCTCEKHLSDQKKEQQQQTPQAII